MQIGLAREPLEIAANDCVGLGELRDALFRGALALAPHVVDEAFAMQRGADDAGRGLEGRQLGGIDRTPLAGVVESDDTDELAGNEDRHDRLGLGADAFESREAYSAAESLLLRQTLRPARSSAHTAAKLRSSQVHIVRVAQMRDDAFGDPLARPRPAAARRRGRPA